MRFAANRNWRAKWRFSHNVVIDCFGFGCETQQPWTQFWWLNSAILIQIEFRLICDQRGGIIMAIIGSFYRRTGSIIFQNESKSDVQPVCARLIWYSIIWFYRFCCHRHHYYHYHWRWRRVRLHTLTTTLTNRFVRFVSNKTRHAGNWFCEQMHGNCSRLKQTASLVGEQRRNAKRKSKKRRWRVSNLTVIWSDCWQQITNCFDGGIGEETAAETRPSTILALSNMQKNSNFFIGLNKWSIEMSSC